MLLALSGTQQPYLKLRLGAVNGADGHVEATGDSLRHYLYAKYVYRQDDAVHGAIATASAARVAKLATG